MKGLQQCDNVLGRVIGGCKVERLLQSLTVRFTVPRIFVFGRCEPFSPVRSVLSVIYRCGTNQQAPFHGILTVVADAAAASTTLESSQLMIYTITHPHPHAFITFAQARKGRARRTHCCIDPPPGIPTYIQSLTCYSNNTARAAHHAVCLCLWLAEATEIPGELANTAAVE